MLTQSLLICNCSSNLCGFPLSLNLSVLCRNLWIICGLWYHWDLLNFFSTGWQMSKFLLVSSFFVIGSHIKLIMWLKSNDTTTGNPVAETSFVLWLLLVVALYFQNIVFDLGLRWTLTSKRWCSLQCMKKIANFFLSSGASFEK